MPYRGNSDKLKTCAQKRLMSNCTGTAKCYFKNPSRSTRNFGKQWRKTVLLETYSKNFFHKRAVTV